MCLEKLNCIFVEISVLMLQSLTVAVFKLIFFIFTEQISGAETATKVIYLILFINFTLIMRTLFSTE